MSSVRKNRRLTLNHSLNREQGTNRSVFDKKFLVILGYVFYVSLLILSKMPYLANEVLESRLDDTIDYSVTFSENGWKEYCYVELDNESRYGNIYVEYTRSTNTLEVKSSNIKVLTLDCRGLFEDKSEKIFGISYKENSNYYKWFFIEKNHLNVNVDSDLIIENLTFKDTPLPYEVRVNGEKWLEKENYLFDSTMGLVMSNVPSGHSNVDVYFKSPDTFIPVARIDSNRDRIYIFESIKLTGENSYDPDGQNIQYFWDFGDGNYISNKITVEHSYDNEGIFGVILTVRDEDQLISHAYLNITVLNGSYPSIRGRIPDQIRSEDSGSWELNLTGFVPSERYSQKDYTWYMTGEDSSLYSLNGENSSNNILIFTPVKNAFGNNKAKIWVTNNDGISLVQNIWINITPVNDPPIIIGAPDLVLQYDNPYRFNYESYIFDVDTPRNELSLISSDSEHTSVSGLTVTYTYPKSYVGEKNVFVILTVDDGEHQSKDIIEVKVIDGFIPRLLKQFPSIELFEGETRYYALNLDDYFSCRNDDCTYQVIDSNRVNVIIHENKSVTFKAPHDWTGLETMKIRAVNSNGALIEGLIDVYVLPINDPPSISSIPDIVVHYDRDYILDLRPFVFDEDDAFETLHISTSDPEHIKLSGAKTHSLILNYPIKSTLPYTNEVTLFVSDNSVQTSRGFRVIVSTNHPPELLKPLPDIAFYEDTNLKNAFNIFDYFIDEDGDELQYEFSTKVITTTISENGGMNFGAPPNWYGYDSVIITVKDDSEFSGLCITRFEAYVIPVNDMPVFSKIPDIRINISEIYKIDLIPYVSDIDNDVHELILTLNSTGIECELFGFDLVIYGNKSLTSKIEIEATDGDERAKQVVFVSVVEHNAPIKDSMFLLWVITLILTIMMITTGFASYRRYYGKYKVVEIFLIYENGCLLKHSTTGSNSRNESEVDLVGSMFTAVQDFIEDSFSGGKPGEKEWSLKKMEFGKNNIFIERGKRIYLAVIFTGNSGKRLNKQSREIINHIERDYKNQLKDWDGEIETFNNVKIELK